jgi:hypothetical protein
MWLNDVHHEDNESSKAKANGGVGEEECRTINRIVGKLLCHVIDHVTKSPTPSNYTTSSATTTSSTSTRASLMDHRVAQYRL